MLLLDEVHRLTSKGQEKLFEFLDHKRITPLGSTNGHEVDIRLVCATTENLNSNFLTTFLRRIPIQVKIPALKRRTKQEKEQLIMLFFRIQQTKINRKVFVSNRVINYLLLQDYLNNVGQLKNDVVLTVANALAKSVNDDQNNLEVDIPDLPPEILSWSKNHNNALIKDDDQFIDVDNSMESDGDNNLIYNTFKSIYKLQHLNELKNTDLNESINSQLSVLSHSLVFSPTLKKGGIPFDYINELVDNILNDNKNRFEVKFVNNLNVVLSHYLCEIQYERRVITEEDNLFQNGLLTRFEEQNSEIKDFVDSLLSDINHVLGYGNNIEDHIFVYSYLENNLYQISNQPIKAIILAHGYSVASSIAETVNEMIGQHIFDYLNMPLNISIKEIGEGILQNYSLNELIENAVNKIGIDKNIIYPKEIKKNLIITCCLTGVGTANKIKKLLTKVLTSLTK